jgi:diguanylate cyclase (GGDEF)-like protein
MGIRRWKLWSLPTGATAYLLAVEAVAVATTAVLGARLPVTGPALGYFGVIVALGILAAESTRRVERMRRWFAHGPHVNMSSVWTLAAALLTTPLLAAATAAILYGHLWARSWYRVRGVQPFRVVFNVSIVVLSCHAAAVVARTLGGPAPLAAYSASPLPLLGALLVIAAYSLVNSALAAGALALLRDQRSLRGVLGSWAENSLEYATLCVGVVTAALLSWRPWLVALVLLPLYVLHRSVLVRQLQHAATVDEKTGLLNASTWHSLATTQVERARRDGTTLSLLMADLDHFTEVNEECGRLAGDRALRMVADAMRQEVRSADLCGRLGGEEFGILLADTDVDGAVRVANRMCQRIGSLRVTVTVTDPNTVPAGRPVCLSMSIGAATFPDAGPAGLDDMLLAADNALFAAKDAGRGRARAAQFSNI